jgi:uncharacterized protein involved in tolerance to divalent cations
MKSATSEGVGLSIVSFVTETTEHAEKLAHQLLDKNLVADCHIIGGSYVRMYMKGKKELIDDKLVKVKFVTADYFVPQVMKLITESNPNESKELPLLVSQLTAGSQEYISWVKAQFASAEKPEDDTNL